MEKTKKGGIREGEYKKERFNLVVWLNKIYEIGERR